LPGRYSMSFQGRGVFSLHDDDVPVMAGRVDVAESGGQVVLNLSGCSSGSMTVDGVRAELLRKVFAAIDGKTCFSDICQQFSGTYPADQLRVLCQGLFGYAVLVPEAIQSLEMGIRRVEIVRFPMQSPYLILREYWSNSRDVRSAIPDFLTRLQTLSSFKSALADLHILATMGSELNTFYGGSGGVPTIPGGYRVHPVRTGLEEVKACFIDRYLRQVGLKAFRRDERFVVSESGLLLGMLVNDGFVFRHPPTEEGYLEALLDAMREVLVELVGVMRSGSNDNVIMLLSRFHKLFLHAHPFYNINNSVAMNIINYCLMQKGLGVIPHLLLDFIALRTEFDDYAQVFRRAVEDYAFATDGGTSDSEVLVRIGLYFEQLESGC